MTTPRTGLARWLRRLGVLIALGAAALFVYSIVQTFADAERGMFDFDGPDLAPVAGYVFTGGILLWVAGIVVERLGAPGVPLQTVGPYAAPPAAPAPPAQDRLAQLEELAGARRSGTISETEFETRKARILGGGE